MSISIQYSLNAWSRTAGLRRLATVVAMAMLGLVATGCKPATETPPSGGRAGGMRFAAEVERGPLIPVTGTVTLDGQPLARVLIQVAPEGCPAAQGYSDDAGRFALTTHLQGDGVYSGTHRVAVVCVLGPGEGGLAPRVPDVYQDLTTTPLRVTIEPQTADVCLELTSSP